MQSHSNSASELNQEKVENKINLRPTSHSFDTDLAEKYGVEIAIMLKHINYWVNYNINLKANFHEGRYWFYNTLDEIAAHFPYWSKDQVYRILKKMVAKELILKGNFNKTSMDRTVWYTINSNMHIAKSQNGYCEIATPIPNTNTNTKESISKDIPKKKTLTSIPKEKLIEREPNVKTTQKEHDRLETDFGEEVVDGAYKELSEWKERTPRAQWKKVDNLTVRKWGINAYYEQRDRVKKLKKFQGGESNRDLANKIIENFQGKAKEKHMRIEVNPTGIMFVFTQSQKAPSLFKYSENGFKSQIDNFMRKYKLLT